MICGLILKQSSIGKDDQKFHDKGEDYKCFDTQNTIAYTRKISQRYYAIAFKLATHQLIHSQNWCVSLLRTKAYLYYFA